MRRTRRLQLHQLAIVQIGWNFSILNGQADSRAGVRRQFELELIPAFIEGRRRDDAALQNHVFVRAGVDFGRKPGTVQGLK
jgi:hypothetical protein